MRSFKNLPTMIEVKKLHKSFGKKKVLQGIDIDVKKKESLVIIGGSGTGKSVLLKIILGLMEPDFGTILVNNQDLSLLSKRKKRKIYDKVGMLFQGGALFDSLVVWRNICFSLINNQSISKEEAIEIAFNKLQKVGLPKEVAFLYPSELSGGMQKRVGLARAIATDPEILFFDEPTTGLDPIMSDLINHLIRECVTDIGATAVTITHDMSSVRKIADRVAMLHMGQIIWHGLVDDIDGSHNPYVDQFIYGRSEGPITTHLKL